MYKSTVYQINLFYQLFALPLFPVYSDGPLFPPEHELSLNAEGLERPKRKRGRPPKQIVHSDDENENKEKENEKTKVSEEVEEEMESSDGRRRRKIRPPAKFAELVQVKFKTAE